MALMGKVSPKEVAARFGLTVRNVEVGAYLVAMKEYGCKIEDILAVFCHSPFKVVKGIPDSGLKV